MLKARTGLVANGAAGTPSVAPAAIANVKPQTTSTPKMASSGLMSAATQWKPAQATTSTYNPSKASTTTYDPTKVDRTGTTYDPTTQQVQDNQLTSNQLTDLTSGNSKYIQDARQTGAEQAAKSGLMTSSIAAGNAERAAVQAAEPIAQADAARYGQVADENQSAQNQADQFNANSNLSASEQDAAAQNTASQFNANAQNQTSQFNANSQNQAAAFNAGAQNQTSQFNAGQTNSVTTAQHQLGAQQTNNYIGMTNNREQEMAAVLQGIYNNPDLTPEQQQQAAANAKSVFQGLWNATDNTFSAGVPQIFTNV